MFDNMNPISIRLAKNKLSTSNDSVGHSTAPNLIRQNIDNSNDVFVICYIKFFLANSVKMCCSCIQIGVQYAYRFCLICLHINVYNKCTHLTCLPSSSRTCCNCKI